MKESTFIDYLIAYCTQFRRCSLHIGSPIYHLEYPVEYLVEGRLYPCIPLYHIYIYRVPAYIYIYIYIYMCHIESLYSTLWGTLPPTGYPIEYTEDRKFKYGKPFGAQDLRSPRLNCSRLGNRFLQRKFRTKKNSLINTLQNTPLYIYIYIYMYIYIYIYIYIHTLN